MSVYSCLFVSLSKESPFDSRLLALPDMEVSGVRRSWEIALSKFARICSFLARMAASSFSLLFFSFSSAKAHSPKIDKKMLFQMHPAARFQLKCRPHRIRGHSTRTARYMHFALESVFVVAPACLLFLRTHAATPFFIA